MSLLFPLVVRTLDVLMGADVELMRHWIEQPDAHLTGQCSRMLLFSVAGLGCLTADLDRALDPQAGRTGSAGSAYQCCGYERA